MQGIENGDKPLADLRYEAERVIMAAKQEGLPVRLTGGIAIARLCPSATRPPLARTYADFDLVVAYRDRSKLDDLMGRLGYAPDREFNGIHGHQRMYFVDMQHQRHVDVFVDAIRMCHVINVSNRLTLCPDTLTPSDLLLTKLQIVELNLKDMLDILALLHSLPVVAGSNDAIDSDYLGKVWGADWPIWRTSQLTLQKVRSGMDEVLQSDALDPVRRNLDALDRVQEECPKSMKWKVRARVGDRVRWYELPEEIE